MTPPRTAQPPVAAFPVFRVVIAPDGASATFNTHPVFTAGHPDLLTAVHATASAAAARFGRPVRMELVTPTGQTRTLTAQPTAQAAPTPGPSVRVPHPAATAEPIPGDPAAAVLADTEPAELVTAGAVLADTEPVELAAAEPGEPVTTEAELAADTEPAEAVLVGAVLADIEPAELVAAGPVADPIRATDPLPVTAPVPLPPRGDAVTTFETTPTTPPASPVNGVTQHRRLTPLDDPLPTGSTTGDTLTGRTVSPTWHRRSARSPRSGSPAGRAFPACRATRPRR